MKWVGVPEQAANVVYVCARCRSACAFEHMIRFVLSETCISAVALIVLWSSYCYFCFVLVNVIVSCFHGVRDGQHISAAVVVCLQFCVLVR